MWTQFAESPWPGVVVGAVLAVMLFAGHQQTGRRELLWGAVGALLLGAALVGLERWLVTYREEVNDRIYELAAKAEANDVAGILAAIHPDAPDVRSLVETYLRQVHVEHVGVNPPKLEIQAERNPPRATAEFKVVVRIAEFARPIPRLIRLTLYREPQGWMVYEAADDEFMSGV